MLLAANFFSLKKDLGLKERAFQAMKNLEIEIKEMHSLRNSLQTNVNDSLLGAVKTDNEELTARYIYEYDDLANLLNMIKTTEMLLQNLSIKVDSACYLYEYVNILNSALNSVRVIRSDMSKIVPILDSALDRISSSIMEMRTELKIMQLAEKLGCELPVTATQINLELPTTVQTRPANIGAINLTTFTTAVHTQV
ncbi:MAG: hypothetical protein ACE5KA_08520 [Nitrososphaerales archaeon]